MGCIAADLPRSQAAYDRAYTELFATLDRINDLLGNSTLSLW